MNCLYCPPDAESCRVCAPPPKGPAEDPRFPGASSTQQKQIRRGLHPLGRALPGPAGETCGSCARSYNTNQNPDGKAIYQCEQATAGTSCQVRVRWPACARWRSVPADLADQRAEREAGSQP